MSGIFIRYMDTMNFIGLENLRWPPQLNLYVYIRAILKSGIIQSLNAHLKMYIVVGKYNLNVTTSKMATKFNFKLLDIRQKYWE